MTTTTTITRILLPDGWHDVATVSWPDFRGVPGYAALLTSNRRWLVGPASAVLAVEESDDDTLDALLARMHSAGLFANNAEFVDLLAGLVEDIVAYRSRPDNADDAEVTP
jgi:hypothetical protein